MFLLVINIFVRSDNAACYHCSSLWITIPHISLLMGITVQRFDFSEAQNENSYCGAKNSTHAWEDKKGVAEDINVLTAGDMKEAIDDYGGVAGCQTAHVDMSVHHIPVLPPIKGISKYSNVQYEGNGSVTSMKGMQYWFWEDNIASYNSFQLGAYCHNRFLGTINFRG
ncbi:uncharacterized protein LOC125650391 [Ostrea edulis]|uniref:uncharacterized protein LOC125650391 n=1 Tax=Ostrea edulis TaxID=37623 RepID=UPI0024AFB19D|nr:uncharacterized protein LOC125650391 [Ostrea edulis]